jgi:hypothetical protein
MANTKMRFFKRGENRLAGRAVPSCVGPIMDHLHREETVMDKIKRPERPNPNVESEKESPRHLKVRTDLKGGAVAAFGFICGRTAPESITGAPAAVWR